MKEEKLDRSTSTIVTYNFSEAKELELSLNNDEGETEYFLYLRTADSESRSVDGGWNNKSLFSMIYATIVLNREQVVALRDTINEALKIHPEIDDIIRNIEESEINQ